MSADNGIYILKTEGDEFRVAHCQAIENLTYGDPGGDEEYMLLLFSDSEVFGDEQEAMMKAKELYDEIMADEFCPVVEYGIQFISLPKKFPSEPTVGQGS